MDPIENKQDAAPAPAASNEALDDMDCRAESQYPEANREAATPDYIREMLAGKKGDQPAAPDPAPAPKNENPA
jgi:hypothetical protein